MDYIPDNETPMMNEEAPVENPEVTEPEKKVEEVKEGE